MQPLFELSLTKGISCKAIEVLLLAGRTRFRANGCLQLARVGMEASCIRASSKGTRYTRWATQNRVCDAANRIYVGLGSLAWQQQPGFAVGLLGDSPLWVLLRARMAAAVTSAQGCAIARSIEPHRPPCDQLAAPDRRVQPSSSRGRASSPQFKSPCHPLRLGSRAASRGSTTDCKPQLAACRCAARDSAAAAVAAAHAACHPPCHTPSAFPSAGTPFRLLPHCHLH